MFDINSGTTYTNTYHGKSLSMEDLKEIIDKVKVLPKYEIRMHHYTLLLFMEAFNILEKKDCGRSLFVPTLIDDLIGIPITYLDTMSSGCFVLLKDGELCMWVDLINGKSYTFKRGE